MAIKVQQEVSCYEKDGVECVGLKEPKIIVCSHWNLKEMVVLKIGKEAFTVLASDLRKAISNAENS